MRTYTDEQLMAFVDGELKAPLAREIAEAAAGSAALSRRIEVFTGTRRLLAATFQAHKNEPVPDRLLQILRPAREGRPAGMRTTMKARRRLRHPVQEWRLALAASVALAIGIGFGHWWPTQQDPRGYGPDHALVSAALEQNHSGVPAVTVAGEIRTEVVPLATWRLGDGAWCREFDAAEIADGRMQRTQGIACRKGAGRWEIRALASAADTGLSPPAGAEGSYRTASGPRQGLLSTLGPAQRLTPADEEHLIDNRWSTR